MELLEYGADVNAQGSTYESLGMAAMGKKSFERLSVPLIPQNRAAVARPARAMGCVIATTAARSLRSDGENLVGTFTASMSDPLHLLLYSRTSAPRSSDHHIISESGMGASFIIARLTSCEYFISQTRRGGVVQGIVGLLCLGR